MPLTPETINSLVQQFPMVIILLLIFRWLRADVKELILQKDENSKLVLQAYFGLSNHVATAHLGGAPSLPTNQAVQRRYSPEATT